MAWVRLDDHFDEHDKFVAAGPDAGWMFIRSLANCNRRESDGHIPTAQLARIGSDFGPRKRQQLAARLVSVGMWHEPGHDCDRCPNPGEGWQVHDYPDYQPSRASKENERSEARERMRRARQTNKNRSSEDVRTEQGENDAGSSVNPGPGPVPEGDANASPDDVFAADVCSLTRLLASRVKANGHKIPAVGSKAHWDWFDHIDKLLRLDAADPTEVGQVIEWATDDDFWRANVRSADKLRKQYSQLRLQRQRESHPNGHRPPKGGQAAQAWNQLADQLEQQEATQ